MGRPCARAAAMVSSGLAHLHHQQQQTAGVPGWPQACNLHAYILQDCKTSTFNPVLALHVTPLRCEEAAWCQTPGFRWILIPPAPLSLKLQPYQSDNMLARLAASSSSSTSL